MFARFSAWILTLLLSAMLISCSGGGGSGSTVAAGGGIAVGGAVVKGPVANANIDIYTFAASGSKGTFVVGGITSDGYGEWTATIPAGQTGPFMVIATGGSYVDEYTNATVQMGGRSFSGVMDANATTAPISPITDAALTTTRQMVADGYAANFAAALPIVQANYKNSFGFDPLTVIPLAPEKLGTAPATT